MLLVRRTRTGFLFACEQGHDASVIKLVKRKTLFASLQEDGQELVGEEEEEGELPQTTRDLSAVQKPKREAGLDSGAEETVWPEELLRTMMGKGFGKECYVKKSTVDVSFLLEESAPHVDDIGVIIDLEQFITRMYEEQHGSLAAESLEDVQSLVPNGAGVDECEKMPCWS